VTTVIPDSGNGQILGFFLRGGIDQKVSRVFLTVTKLTFLRSAAFRLSYTSLIKSLALRQDHAGKF